MDFHVHKRTVMMIAAVLAAAILILGVEFVIAYKHAAPAQIITPNRISELVRQHETLGQNEVSSIAAWMTFDYIEHVFVLPSGYLKAALGIPDPRYPQLSLSRYAKDASLSPTDVVAKVQDAVKEYFAAAAAH